jgi:hypothetical protein
VRAKRASGSKCGKARGARRGDLLGRRIDAKAIISSPSCLSVYSSRTCIGFLMPRGKLGIEACDVDGRSLGLFLNQRIAANAVFASQRRAP